MKLRSQIVLRLDRRKITVYVIGQAETRTEDAVVAQNLIRREIAALGTRALDYKGREGYDLVWPFQHPRLFVADWDSARRLFQWLLKESHTGLPFIKPEVLIQVTEPLEGGLGQIERRALLHALMEAGVGLGTVYEGNETLAPEKVEELLKAERL